MFAPSPAAQRWWAEDTAAAQTKPPCRLLSFDAWLQRKQRLGRVEEARRRERVLRASVLSLFHRYQGEVAYQRWCEEVEARPEPPPTPLPPPVLDPSHFHYRPSSSPFLVSSSLPYLSWLDEKTTEQLLTQRQQRLQEERRREEAAKAEAEAAILAQQRFAHWKARKYAEQRALQTSLAQRTTQQQAAEQQRREERVMLSRQHFREWRAVKAKQAARQQQREERAQQRQQLRRQQRQEQFTAQFPTLVASYVRTLHQWKRDEARARQRQAVRRPLHPVKRSPRPITPAAETVESARKVGRLDLSTVSTEASMASTSGSEASARGSSVGGQKATRRQRRPAWNADTTLE